MWAIIALYKFYVVMSTYLARIQKTNMVERAGFEPAKPVRAAVLQTAPISRSGTSPYKDVYRQP
jgi:hypothetical protein